MKNRSNNEKSTKLPISTVRELSFQTVLPLLATIAFCFPVKLLQKQLFPQEVVAKTGVVVSRCHRRSRKSALAALANVGRSPKSVVAALAKAVEAPF